MSSIIFHVEDYQVLVATDTLATSDDGKPAYFTSKAFILPHLKMILAGTGRPGFLDRWVIGINGSPIRDIDTLDRETPGYLASAWLGYKQEIAKPNASATATVYHFGFSEGMGVIHAYAYRSENGFQSERLKHGTHVKPECTVPANYKLPDDIKSIMNEQRTVQSRQPNDKRIHIGGEILIHHLTREGFNVYKLAEVDDYKKQRRIIYKS